ncbi:hypothetical protein ACFQWB_11985 [Paenibacillus thermoaerophilus]|uniref:Uncharacterized protein n=1 Tax=Paenibacillus thermoaerophilus TaxID=1215385 RepID=A0ABW2V6X6_9BACL|nr:hypothetical protein [Paenibacillus thermoaerophilus]TMV17678.1 hypothetical protein FE781_05975 [Paenibacillus thermoaerophilus]
MKAITIKIVERPAALLHGKTRLFLFKNQTKRRFVKKVQGADKSAKRAGTAEQKSPIAGKIVRVYL